MENMYLRAKRNFESNVDFVTPEFANNILDVEVSVPQGLDGVNDVSVRIYSSSYKLVSAECVLHQVGKTFRKALLQMGSEEVWCEGLYRVYVYVNSVPKWFCELSLKDDNEKWYKAALKPIEENYGEMMFADKWCLTDWWHKIHCARFKEPLVKLLVERLGAFSRDLNNGTISKVPALLVIGDGETVGASALSSMVIGGYITDDDISKRYRFSLEELATCSYGWNHMVDEIAQAKAVIVDVPELKYTGPVINLVNLFASVIKYDTFRNTTFIFNGMRQNINLMMEHCVLMKDLFTEETTFRLTYDRSVVIDDENFGEFEALLKNFIENDSEAEDSSCEKEEPAVVNECIDAEKKLAAMVGLQRVKDDIQEARTMALFNKKRAEYCLQTNDKNCNHMLFLGNPGTGKTTVARLIGKMYYGMGLLSKGHTVETNRAKLVGEFIGMTEKKVLETIEEARGGVLFIDEAYALVTDETDKKDFGREVLNALLTVLSEPNPDMIIILAGYEDKMNVMLKTNPGLKDRFPLTFHFEDYSASELMEIACRTLDERNFNLTEDARDCLAGIIERYSANRDCYFGNGRWVHNLIEQGIIKSMARRVMSSPAANGLFDVNLFCTVEKDDVLDAERNFLQSKTIRMFSPRPIGFRA